MVNNCLLKTVRFVDTKQWDVKHFFATSIISRYPTESIGKHTIHITEKTKLFNEPEKEHKILGISNERGMFDAYVELGKNINQAYIYVENGCLAYNPYRINVGSIGLKTELQKNEYISPAYVVFKCKDTLLPEFLYLVLKSTVFNSIIREKTTGAVRQTLSYDNLATINIPVPSIETQKDLVHKYNTRLAEAKKEQNLIDNLQAQIEQYILKELGISFLKSSFNGLIGTTDYKNLTRWDPLYLSSKILVDSNEKMVDMATVIAHFMVDTSGKSLRINTREEPDKKFAYIGMEHVEKNTGKVFMQQISGKDVLSQTIRVPCNYIIYGKLRPYLNKYWENKSATQNVICSSEFFVFDIKNINRIYFMEILSSVIIQEQLLPLYSGARMPRINESDFVGLKIPLPSAQKQQEIADFISGIRKNIATLQSQIPLHAQQAKKEFEEAVFGETQEIKN